MNDSSTTGRRTKPPKPYPEFPLFPHAMGVWAKKIRGKLHYFGPWADWQGALRRYVDQRGALYAGRTPGPGPEGVTIKDLLNRFLTAKDDLLQTGELTQRTFDDYRAVCHQINEEFGLERRVASLTVEDFERFRSKLAKGKGPVTLGNEIQRIRTVFKYGFDAGLLDKPVRFGPTFRKPGRRLLRRARAQNGEKMFEAAELRRFLGAAGQPLRAMILLGINCGFGNHDVGGLPLAALDLDGGWVRFPRSKTGIACRCPLWPETVTAIREALALRPAPKEAKAQALVFVTKRGAAWSKDSKDNPVAKESAKVIHRLGLERMRRGFYALRHTFETVAGESRDQVAVDYIMGHSREDMASAYRERISDERLRAVVEHVRTWLFGGEAVQ